jgi:hypothetical protein
MKPNPAPKDLMPGGEKRNENPDSVVQEPAARRAPPLDRLDASSKMRLKICVGRSIQP